MGLLFTGPYIREEMGVFKNKDRVTYNNLHKATVVDCDWVNNEFTVEFDNKSLIPSRMKVSGGLLSLGTANIGLLEEFERLVGEKDVSFVCPKCQKRYITRPLFTTLWVGCGKCGRSREEIQKRG